MKWKVSSQKLNSVGFLSFKIETRKFYWDTLVELNSNTPLVTPSPPISLSMSSQHDTRRPPPICMVIIIRSSETTTTGVSHSNLLLHNPRPRPPRRPPSPPSAPSNPPPNPQLAQSQSRLLRGICLVPRLWTVCRLHAIGDPSSFTARDGDGDV